MLVIKGAELQSWGVLGGVINICRRTHAPGSFPMHGEVGDKCPSSSPSWGCPMGEAAVCQWTQCDSAHMKTKCTSRIINPDLIL